MAKPHSVYQFTVHLQVTQSSLQPIPYQMNCYRNITLSQRHTSIDFHFIIYSLQLVLTNPQHKLLVGLMNRLLLHCGFWQLLRNLYRRGTHGNILINLDDDRTFVFCIYRTYIFFGYFHNSITLVIVIIIINNLLWIIDIYITCTIMYL